MNTTMLTPSANTALEHYWEDYLTLPQSDAALYPPAAAGVRLAEIRECGHFPMYSDPVGMWRWVGEALRLEEGGLE